MEYSTYAPFCTLFLSEVIHNEQIDRFVRLEYLVLGGVSAVESLLNVGQQVAGRLADDRDAAAISCKAMAAARCVLPVP